MDDVKVEVKQILTQYLEQNNMRKTVEDLPGVEKAKASASANTLTIKGSATEETIRAAVEGIGYTFKGKA